MHDFKLPVVRLRIGEVRGFVLISGHRHTQWLKGNSEECLPDFDKVLKRGVIGVWVWSREVWYGGPIDEIESHGPLLEVREGAGCWHIDWGDHSGFEFKYGRLERKISEYEERHVPQESIKIPDMVAQLKELLHQLSLYDAQGLGLLLISLPHGYRFVLEENPLVLRLYVEGDRHFGEREGEE